MASPINVLVFTQQFYHRETSSSIKSTGSSLYMYMLPQYTVALRVSRNYSKVANLKWSKFRNCSPFFFFSSQPSTIMWEVTWLKQPSIMRKFPKDGSFVVSLKRNYSLRWASSNDLLSMCYHSGRHFHHWACCRPHNNTIINSGCMGESFTQCN